VCCVLLGMWEGGSEGIFMEGSRGAGGAWPMDVRCVMITRVCCRKFDFRLRA
jgi:hypothetical protein